MRHSGRSLSGAKPSWINWRSLSGIVRIWKRRFQPFADDIKEYVQAKADAEQRHKTWQAEWSEAVKTIGLDEGTTPDEALVTLSKFEDLFKKIDECDTLEQRIFGIHRDAEVFHADVKALIGHAAPEWSNLMPDQAVVQLNAELTRARKAAARHAQLAEEIEQKRRGLGDAEKEIALAREILDSLCRQAGCANPDELESREKLSADYQDLRRQIRSLEADIVERGGGAALEQILQQIETGRYRRLGRTDRRPGEPPWGIEGASKTRFMKRSAACAAS